MKVYSVIPAYNEANTVGNIIKTAKQYSEVIVVDDCSKDDTYNVSKNAGAIVVKHETNQGYGKGLRDGIEEAINQGAEVIVTLDADGQHNPNDIPKLVKEIENGFDVVAGSRFLGGKQWGTWKRMFAVRALALETRVLAGVTITDIQSGFRAYRAEVLKNVKISDFGMGVSVEVPIKAKRLGYKFKEVPIEISSPHRIKSMSSVIRQGIAVGYAIIKHSFF